MDCNTASCKRYPSLDPRVPPDARLRMWLRELSRPLTPAEEFGFWADELIELVSNPPESLGNEKKFKKSDPEGGSTPCRHG